MAIGILNKNWENQITGGTMMGTKIEMKVNCKKDAVLLKLKENRENHIKIFEESVQSYVKAAICYLEEVEKQIHEIKGELEEHNYKTALRLKHPLCTMPFNYVHVYDIAIEMLEWHTDDTIELSSNEVKNLIQDMWDWQGEFLGIASQYSSVATNYAISKGYAVWDEA